MGEVSKMERKDTVGRDGEITDVVYTDHGRVVAGPSGASTIKALIENAVSVAEKAGPANYINVRCGVYHVTLTTHIKGKPLAWIEYSAEQLDDLIATLRLYSDKIKSR